MIIYRELLKKYIDHIGIQEGTDFLHPKYLDDQMFTEDEWVELVKLSEEVRTAFYGKECI
jgi:hypothetical protein